MYVWVSACVYKHHIRAQYPKRSEEGVISPGTGVTHGLWAIWCACWGPNLGPLQKTVRALNRCAVSSAPICPVLHQRKMTINKDHVACQGSHWYWGRGKDLNLNYCMQFYGTAVLRGVSRLTRILLPRTGCWGGTHIVRTLRATWLG